MSTELAKAIRQIEALKQEIASMRQCFEQTERDRDFYKMEARHLRQDLERYQSKELTNGNAQ